MEEHPLLENGVEVLKLLLEHGGDIDQTDEAGQTALHTGATRTCARMRAQTLAIRVKTPCPLSP